MGNEPSSPDIVKAAQITTVFSFMYGCTFINVLISKKRCYRNAKKTNNKNYDRYTSPDMRPADRLQANFLEWSPVFLGLMWSLAATNNLGTTGTSMCWTYIALRGLYVVLILRFGVSTSGNNVSLWASTFPAYGCLMYLSFRAIRLLFFP